MSEMITIARPYAKAVFELACEKGDFKKWSSMLTFAAQVSCDSVVNQLLTSARSPSYIQDVFIKACGDEIDAECQNLIKTMAENSRLLALPEVLAQFSSLYRDFEKQINVELISAVELEDEQLKAITSKLEARLGRKIILNCTVNEELIAGTIIRANDLVIDNSVSSRIRRLSDALQS
ncbi:MAG: F0F1 ATP synthase subunit delta [Enterovibrio sp.]